MYYVQSPTIILSAYNVSPHGVAKGALVGIWLSFV